MPRLGKACLVEENFKECRERMGRRCGGWNEKGNAVGKLVADEYAEHQWLWTREKRVS